MKLALDRVVPWGRSLPEYIQMFNLTEADLNRSILDCASGPASFNAEMTALGHVVRSYDPIYHFSASDIAQRIQTTKPVILEGVKAALDSYVWTTFTSPEQLCEARLATMQKFLEDFPKGQPKGRYCVASLPDLPIPDHQFDLALCSHFLFAYSDHFSLEFHWDAIQELLRVASEVRIFPILTLAGERSPFLDPILTRLDTQYSSTHRVSVETVRYEFQKGGNQQLRIIS